MIRRLFVAAVLASSVLLPRLAAQCGTWETRFNAPGMNNEVNAVLSWDDGGGTALYAAGKFMRAGNVAVQRIARWRDGQWTPLSSGLQVDVNALCVFDDGSGEHLYAATNTAVFRWSGTSWSQLGGFFDGAVNALAVYNGGAGAQLYCAGGFGQGASGLPRGIAVWNGSSWFAVGSGVGPTSGGIVRALCVFEDGSGAQLYAGGMFDTSGAIVSPDLVRWNGTFWSSVGPGVSSNSSEGVTALTLADLGGGPVLALAGVFNTLAGVPSKHVGTWDGTNLIPLGMEINGALSTICDSPFGLIVGGNFSSFAPTFFNGAARWNGSAWETVGGPGITVQCSTVHDDGSGPRLFAGGAFSIAGGGRLKTFDGSTWAPLPDGLGLNGQVRSMATFDDGSGGRLFVGGSFSFAGNRPAANLARWDGNDWSALPSQLDGTVSALLSWNDGSGPGLVAAGSFMHAGAATVNRIARWDGTNWTAFDSGIGDPSDGFSVDQVLALAAFDPGSGPELYAGGVFGGASGHVAVGVARWSGSTWTDLEVGMNNQVLDLLTWDDGTGPALYVAGSFTSAGSVPANRIAKWNGTSWSALGVGANNEVKSLVPFDDGSGMKLYVGGLFTSIGGVAAHGVARWDGSNWSAVVSPGIGVDHLRVADVGSGPQLLATGEFRLVKLTGGSWTTLGTFTNSIQALSVFDTQADGSPDVYVGAGNFTISGTIISSGIGVLRGCGQSGVAYCSGDGLGTPCPCGNDGWTSHGCGNSAFAEGAALAVSGVPSVSHDSLLLRCSAMPANTSTLFVQATGQANSGFGNQLGDGLICISGSVVRLGVLIANGDSASFGFGTATQSISQRGAIPLGGATRHYQVRYRNATNYCTSATFNQSNGVSVVWEP